MTPPLRFLLDQQFPQPMFDVQALDHTISYEHFSAHAPAASATSTPDWMLHLIAAEGGFDGVVTLDRSQLDQETELIALALAGVSVVTWQNGDEDPIVLWGQLLAYMPRVRKIMETVRPVVVTLPNPRLQMTKSAVKPREMLAVMKQRDGIDYPQRKLRAVQMMERDLNARGQSKLIRHLHKSDRSSRVAAATSTATRPLGDSSADLF